MSAFQFLRPEFLWLLPLVLILLLIDQKKMMTSSPWEKVCDAPLLKYLLSHKSTGGQKRRLFFLYTGFLAAVLALAGPSFKQQEMPVAFRENPLMIVLDLSSQMKRTDLRPSRLMRAKMQIKDVLDKANVAPTGLIVYTYEPFLINPLVQDADIVSHLLSSVQPDIMPVDGNKLDRALELARTKLKEGGYQKGHILVLTSDVLLDFDKALKEAEKSVHEGFDVSVCGVASNPSDKLKEIAKKGKGVYFNVESSSEKLIDFLNRNLNEKLSEGQNTVSKPLDQGWPLVFVVAFCLLYFFRKGVFVILLTVVFSSSAYAGFFFNNDQEGALLFKAKEFEQAAQKFENENWKASAFYKAQNYPEAIKILQNKKDITSLYNKGNALAKGGKIKEAIDVYEEVLKKDPKHEDARFNLEYLKKMMQNQAQNQKNENQDQNEQQQSAPSQNEQQNENNENNENQAPQNEPTDDNSENENQDEGDAEQSGFDREKQEQDEQSEGKSDENDKQNDMTNQKEKMPQMAAKEEKADQYDETVQAREQQFREIKDNTGGLLKAFIKQEYLKNRYGN